MQETQVRSLGWEDLWRRKWSGKEPTPVLLPGKSHGWRSMVGPWGFKESDTTEWLHSLTHSSGDLTDSGIETKVSHILDGFFTILSTKEAHYKLYILLLCRYIFQFGYLTFPFSSFKECNMLVTEVEPEAPLLWPSGAKSGLIGKDPDVGKDWGAGGEGDDRAWDGWMASLTQWTSVWANSGRQWRTGKPGMLQSMGSQRIGHNLVTEQQQQITIHDVTWPK